MTTETPTAPNTINLRSGRIARLVEQPGFNAVNEAWFVLYEYDHPDFETALRFSLYWPELTYNPPRDKIAHKLDAVDPPAEVTDGLEHTATDDAFSGGFAPNH